MFEVGQKVKHESFGICIISNIETNIVREKEQTCYVLSPVYRNVNMKIHIPVDLPNAKISEVISYDEAIDMIKQMPLAKNIWTNDYKKRKVLFDSIYNSNNFLDRCSLLKTVYQRQAESPFPKKAITTTDLEYCEKIQNQLFEEFAEALNIKITDVNSFIENYLGKIEE